MEIINGINILNSFIRITFRRMRNMMIEKNAKKMGKRALSLLLALLMLAGCMGVSAFAYEPCDEHVPAEPVAENEATASCTEGGSYDEVVYCSVCGEELSRETVTVEALDRQSVV